MIVAGSWTPSHLRITKSGETEANITSILSQVYQLCLEWVKPAFLPLVLFKRW